MFQLNETVLDRCTGTTARVVGVREEEGDVFYTIAGQPLSFDYPEGFRNDFELEKLQ